MKVAIILNSGTPLTRKIKADKIICCDGGYSICPEKPDVILGDFDSLTLPEDLDEDIVVVKHDPHKNAGDGELAVYYAKEQFGADEIVFYGVLGGRYDHTLCNFALMKLATNLGMTAKAEEDRLDLHFVSGKYTLATQKDETISILPFGGNAIVNCEGNLEYPLDNLMLTGSDTRGLSNISHGGKITIDVKYGGVLVFRYIKH